MSRDAPVWIGLGVVLVGLVVMAAAGAFGTTQTISQASPVQTIPEPGGDGSTGVVFDLRASGGRSLFGLQLRSRDYEAGIALISPPECVSRDDSGREELLREGDCAGLAAGGEVTGSGTTSTGLNLVIVRVEVSRQCYEIMSVGDDWPPASEACQSQTRSGRASLLTHLEGE